jgi:hypothetical protein
VASCGLTKIVPNYSAFRRGAFDLISFARFLFVILSLLAASVLPAADQTSVDSTTAAGELKALRDQTIIQSRIWLDTEWDQFKHGAEEARWTLGGLWGWRIADGQDWAVRLKVPFVYDRSDEASGHANIGGVGDIEVATGTAFRLNNTWRTGGGIELHGDTASNAALGDSVWRLHPYWSVAHDVTSWLTLTPTAEYNHSIAEEHNVSVQRYLELSLPVTFILPSDWSIGTNYKAKIDFENGDHWTHTINLGVAKRLSNIPVVVSATFEKQLDGGNKRFQANLIMTYYFERFHLLK